MHFFCQTLLKFTDLFTVRIWGRILNCWCNTGVLFACEFTYLFQPLYHEAHIFLAMELVHETRQRQVEIVHTSNKYKTDIYIIMLQFVHAWKVWGVVPCPNCIWKLAAEWKGQGECSGGMPVDMLAWKCWYYPQTVISSTNKTLMAEATLFPSLEVMWLLYLRLHASSRNVLDWYIHHRNPLCNIFRPKIYYLS